MTVESLTNRLVKNYQNSSDAFFHIYDNLAHIEEPDSTVAHCMEFSWNNHAALENLIAKLEGRPAPY
tara:strand:- start:618 stop:818 length:201 start_codon:yes stop_codon:yes gene_type:complete